MLGIVLKPGIPLYGGNGTYLCPTDPLHNTQGEAGLYYDTQLGAARKGPIKKLFESMRARRVQLSGLHDDPTVAQLVAQEEHNRKILTLSIISTAAVAISALVATIRNAKAIKRGR